MHRGKFSFLFLEKNSLEKTTDTDFHKNNTLQIYKCILIISEVRSLKLLTLYTRIKLHGFTETCKIN